VLMNASVVGSIRVWEREASTISPVRVGPFLGFGADPAGSLSPGRDVGDRSVLGDCPGGCRLRAD